MFALMGRFRVGTRIYTGFGIVLAFLCVVAWLGYDAVHEGESGLDHYSKVSDNALAVATVERQVVGLRRNTYIYYDKGAEASLTRARELIGQLRAEIDATVARTSDPVRKANLERMKEQVGAYAKGVEDVVVKRTQREKLVNEKMNVAGAAARKDLSAIIASAMKDGDNEAAAIAGMTQEKLMLARLGAIRYLATPSEALKTETEQRGQGIHQRRRSPGGATAKSRTQATGNGSRKARPKEYVAAFSEMAQLALDADKLLFGTLTEIGTELSKLSAETLKTQRADLAETMKTTDALFATLATIALTVSATAIVLGLLFAFMVSRGITQPVGAMTGAMNRLAEGDLEAHIPAKENRDEIGEMAKAVQVFKDNAIRVREMEAEQAEAKRRAEEDRRAVMNPAGRFVREERRRRDRDRHLGGGRVAGVVGADGVDRRRDQRPGDHGGVGVRAGVDERGDGRDGRRGAFQLDRRDRTPGRAGVERGGRRGEPGGRDQRQDPGSGPGGVQDRRGGGPDHRHRRADEPSGAERDHRGGAGPAMPARASRWWRRK